MISRRSFASGHCCGCCAHVGTVQLSGRWLEETGVGQKTIRRDLAAFSSAGFPLVSETGEYGRKTWRVADAWGQPPLTFRFDEALALYLGRRFLQPLAGTFFLGSSAKCVPQDPDVPDRGSAQVSRSNGWTVAPHVDRHQRLFGKAIAHRRPPCRRGGRGSVQSSSTNPRRLPKPWSTKSILTASSTTMAQCISWRFPAGTRRCGTSRSTASKPWS